MTMDETGEALVPSGQAYYWTRAWQRDERLAVDEIAQGEVVRFENPADAVRWLGSADA